MYKNKNSKLFTNKNPSWHKSLGQTPIGLPVRGLEAERH